MLSAKFKYPSLCLLSLCVSLFPCLFLSCDSFPPLSSSMGCCTNDSQKGMQLSIHSDQQGVPHCKSAPLFMGFECPPLFQLAGPAIQLPPPYMPPCPTRRLTLLINLYAFMWTLTNTCKWLFFIQSSWISIQDNTEHKPLINEVFPCQSTQTLSSTHTNTLIKIVLTVAWKSDSFKT